MGQREGEERQVCGKQDLPSKNKISSVDGKRWMLFKVVVKF